MTLTFLFVNLIKLIPYYFLDLLVIANLKVSLILSPLAPLSIYLGYYLHKKLLSLHKGTYLITRGINVTHNNEM